MSVFNDIDFDDQCRDKRIYDFDKSKEFCRSKFTSIFDRSKLILNYTYIFNQESEESI